MKRNPIPTGRFVKVHSIRKNKNGTLDVVMTGAKKKNAKKKKRASKKKRAPKKKRTTKRRVTNSRKKRR